MSHTPGPWFAQDMKSTTGENEYWIKFDDFGSIAAVRHGAQDKEYGGKKALKANAQLMACSPEILEALERYVMLFDQYRAAKDDDEKRQIVDANLSHHKEARRIIAKAKGED